MSYYPTIAEDIARAKDIIAKGKAVPPDVAQLPRELVERYAGGTIYGGDIYAAYMLLRSLVEHIEQHLTYLEAQTLKDEIEALQADAERERVARRIVDQALRETAHERDEAREAAHELAGKVQFLVDWADSHGLLGEHVFTFPDGDIWGANSKGLS